MKSPKNCLGRIVGILLDISFAVHEWNNHLEIFRLPQAIENSRQFLLLRTDISENSRWVPLNKYKLAVPKPHTELYKRSLSHSGNVL